MLCAMISSKSYCSTQSYVTATVAPARYIEAELETGRQNTLMTDKHKDLVALISDLATAATMVTKVSLAPFMLSPLEFEILDNCNRGKATSVTELSRIFPVDAPVVSQMVVRLVEMKLIERERLIDDSRWFRLRLTEEGRFLANRMSKCLNATQAILINGVTDRERVIFTQTAQKILANLEANTAPSSTPGAIPGGTLTGVFSNSASEAKGLNYGSRS